MFFTPGFVADAAETRFPSNWDGIVDELLHTTDERLRDHLYLGVHIETREPVLLPRSALRAHTHVLGPSDVGKTQLGLNPLMIQLIRMAGRDLNSGKAPQQSSIVVIDMKGDEVLLQTAALEARRAGLPFRVVTNILGLPTCGFNPLTQRYLATRDSLQQAETIQTGLRLEYGAGYGRDFYSEASLTGLSDLIKAYGRHCQSIKQLHQYVTGKRLYGAAVQAAKKLGLRISKEDKEHMRALLQTLRIIGHIEVANIASNDDRFDKAAVENQIDMLDVCTRPQVLYFCLDSGASNRTSQLLGGLAFYCLYTAACQRRANAFIQGKHSEHEHITYVIVDEFQRLVTEAVGTVFEQARAAGLHIIAAHQNLGQLKFGDIDLSGSVVQSTSNKFVFGARTRDDIEALLYASGDNVSFNYDPYCDIERDIGLGKTVRAEDILDEPWLRLKENRFSRNDIIRLSADHNLSVLQVSRNDGMAVYDGLPFFMECDFPMSLEESRRRKRLLWPVKGSGTFVAVSDMLDEEDDFADVEDEVSDEAISSLEKKQREKKERQKRTRRKASE